MEEAEQMSFVLETESVDDLVDLHLHYCSACVFQTYSMGTVIVVSAEVKASDGTEWECDSVVPPTSCERDFAMDWLVDWSEDVMVVVLVRSPCFDLIQLG